MKETLKTIKLNEGTISMILGAVVVFVVGLLVINYFRDFKNSVSNSPSITKTAAQDQKIPGGTHTVAKGETLWSISESYYKSGYNWVDIAKANKLKNPSKIEEGQKLTIPEVSAKVAAENVIQNNNAVSITSESYTIIKGDSLWKISVRAYGDGYKWTTLAKTNKLRNPNLIYPDQKLQLPR